MILFDIHQGAWLWSLENEKEALKLNCRIFFFFLLCWSHHYWIGGDSSMLAKWKLYLTVNYLKDVCHPRLSPVSGLATRRPRVWCAVWCCCCTSPSASSLSPPTVSSSSSGSGHCPLRLQTKVGEDFTITEKVPTWPFTFHQENQSFSRRCSKSCSLGLNP